MNSKKAFLVIYANHMASQAKYRRRRKQFHLLLIKLLRIMDVQHNPPVMFHLMPTEWFVRIWKNQNVLFQEVL